MMLYYGKTLLSVSLLLLIVSYSESQCDNTFRIGNGLESIGKVSMCLEGTWISICSRGWDYREATVVCRNIGYTGKSFPLRYHFQTGSHVYLNCDEADIVNCSNTTVDNCFPDGVAGVACSDEPCIHGDHHLVGGELYDMGRLEYCYEGEWYTICSDNWDDVGKEARVVCNDLYKYDDASAVVDYYGRGHSPLLPLNIRCQSPNKTLKGCNTEKMDVSECKRVAGVTCIGSCVYDGIHDCNLCDNCSTTKFDDCSCSGTCFSSEESCCNDIAITKNCITKECETGAVELVGGESDSVGYLKICIGGVWGGICTETGVWDDNNARVICQQLGFQTEGVRFRNGSITADLEEINKIVLGGVDCVGTESDLLDCHHLSIGQSWCKSITPDPVIIDCNADNNRLCDEEGVRLVTNSLGTSGQVEFCQNGRWKRVCREGWAFSNTQIFCSQLHFNDILVIEEDYSNPLFVGRFNCSGSEKKLSQCKLDLLPQWRCHSFVVKCNLNRSQETDRSLNNKESIIIATPLALFLFVLIAIIPISILFILYNKHRNKRKAREIIQLDDYRDTMESYNNSITEVSQANSNDVSIEEAISTKNIVSNKINEIPSPKLILTPSYQERELIRENHLISRKDITLTKPIGEGQYGIVYKGTLNVFTKESVAIKTLKGGFDQNDIDMFLEECLKMTRFKNENVMNLVGVCLDTGSAPYLIMPYMANGSLLSYLRKERNSIILLHETDDDEVVEVRKKLMIMCLQIAKGMEYLASEKYVHRDLAARNCMFDDNHQIKITDFGLSEDVYYKHYFRHNSSSGDTTKLPVKWMAPESLNDGHFSEKSDMWSYGVVMWEIFSGGKNPYPASDPRSLMQDLDQGYRMPKPYSSVCSMEIYDIMNDCWKSKPEDRPSFEELTSILRNYTQ